MSSKHKSDATLTVQDFAASGTKDDFRLMVLKAHTYEVYPLPKPGTVVIGRGQVADIILDDNSISRVHAILHVAPDGQLEIEDAQSSNGTTVRGQRLAPEERVAIQPGEAVDLGQVLVIVQSARSWARPRRRWSHGDFEARLEEECARAAATKGTFTMARLSVNAGNDVSPLEQGFVDVLRPYDVMALYAPGIYEVILIDTPGDRAESMLESLRERVDPRTTWTTAWAELPSDGRQPEELMAILADRVAGRSETPTLNSSDIVVEDPSMVAVHRMVDRIGPSDISVLLLGETGVGKEVLAESVHRASARSNEPFLRLNCAALSESLLESELFGHEKGAFTGAAKSKPGLLEAAQGGTVFLDEIGEISLSLQVKLLRVLEERKVRRVGGIETRDIDVRFVAATNRDLEKEIEKGNFRSDLYYRLNGIAIVIPPLRDRPAELKALCLMFAQRFLERSGRRGPPKLTPAAWQLLAAHRWPGNIRELRNIIERAVLLSEDGTITPSHLPRERLDASVVVPKARGFSTVVPKGAASLEDTDIEPGGYGPPPPGLTETQLEDRARIIEALKANAGNQTRASKALGIARRTLLNRLDRYGIARPQKG